MIQQKTVGDIDKEIDVLGERIEQLYKERFLLINTAPPITNAWRDSCNLYNNNEITDEYGE